MPTSPYSFSMIAMRWPWRSLRMRFSSVVFPLPRKPVRRVTGTLMSGGVPMQERATDRHGDGGLAGLDHGDAERMLQRRTQRRHAGAAHHDHVGAMLIA